MKFSVAAAAVALLLSAALAPSSTLAQSSETITVYNAQHASLTKAWVDAFTAETGIKVTLRQGDDTELGQPDRPGRRGLAGGRLPHRELAGDGPGRQRRPVRAVDPATLARSRSEYRPVDGKWTGIAARSTVFVYNKNKLTADKLPKSMLDLAKPEWKGRWAASPVGRRLPGDRRRRCWSSRARPRPQKWLKAHEGKLERLPRQHARR